MQTALLWSFTIVHDTFDASRPGFRNRTQRFDRDIQETTRNVARTRILADLRPILPGIVSIPIHDAIDLTAGLCIPRAIRQNMFGAAELRHLCNQDGSM